jgi:hypothetical protein
MATHTAGPQIQRRRVEHIQHLMAEIGEQEHIAAHLLARTVRAGYYFLTLACLTAGAIGLAQNRHYLAATWGIAGIVLLLLLLGFKGAQKVGGRVVRELRAEFEKGRRPDAAAEAASATESSSQQQPAAEPVAPPVAEDSAGRLT